MAGEKSEESKMWMVLAATSAGCYATGSILFSHATEKPFETRLILCIVQIVVCLGLGPYSYHRYERAQKVEGKESSFAHFVCRHRESYNLMAIIILIIIVEQVAIQASFMETTLANANIGLTVCLISTHSLIAGIVGHFTGYPLTRKQIIPMIIIFVGIQFVIFSKDDDSNSLPVLAALLSFFGAVTIGTTSNFVKKVTAHVDSWFWLAIRTLSEGVIMLPVTIITIYAYYGEWRFELSQQTAIEASIGGLARTAGSLTFNMAIYHGHVGPVSAINSTSTIWSTILDLVVYNIPIPIWGLVGILIVASGIIMSSTLKDDKPADANSDDLKENLIKKQ